MAPLPPARARVHGVAGEAVRAGAIARHAARRTGVLAIAGAKIVLWLSVVVASLAAIGLLGRTSGPRYPDLDRLRDSTERMRRYDHDLAQAQRMYELTYAAEHARAMAEDLRRRRALEAEFARPLAPPSAPPRAAARHR